MKTGRSLSQGGSAGVPDTLPAEAGDPRPGARRVRSWALGRLLRKAVRRELWVPTLLALAGLTLAALTKSLLGYADLVMNRGLGAAAVGALAFFEIVPLVSQTLPFALLIGALVGLGRLKADREVLAIETAGIAPLRMLRPVLAASLGVTVVALGLSVYGAPASREARDRALLQMSLEQPGATLRAGVAQEFGDRRLLASEVSSRGDELRGVLLWMPDVGETVFADSGRVEPLGPGSIRLRLYDASLLTAPEEGLQHVSVGRFQIDLTRAPGAGPGADRDPLETASLAELVQRSSLAPVPAPSDGSPQAEQAVSQPRQAEAELHRRFALGVTPFLFAFLSVPLAMAGGRFSRSSGAVLGLLVTLAYYGLTQLGNGLLRFEAVPVPAAIWLANGATVLVALTLLARESTAHVSDPSPQPLAADAPQSGGLPERVRRFQLDRYVLGIYLRMVLLSFAVLLAAYLIIDVLERLQWFASHGAGVLEVMQFYAARIPLLASRIVPMSLLAGSGLTVSLLGAHGELQAMQACGVWLARGLAPILLLSALIVPVDFLLNDALVPRTNALADRIKVEKIKDRASLAETDIWFRAQDQLIRAPRIGLELGEVQGLTIYQMGPGGLPVARIDARRAWHVAEGEWALEDASQVDISPSGIRQVAPPESLRLGATRQAELDPMHLSVRELSDEIRSAEQSDYVTTPWRVHLHQKLAAPVACVLLPGIAILLALSTGHRPSTARSLLLCGALGISYLLVVDVAASLGLGGRLAPPAAGWAPPALAAVLGFGLVLRRRA